MPSISMNPSARYTTQSGIYTSMFTGPLTDRAIARYRKKGFYGKDGILFQSNEKARCKAAKRRGSATVLKFVTD